MTFESPQRKQEFIFWTRALDRATNLKDAKLQGRDMDSFINLYGNETITRDKSEIQQKKEVIEHELGQMESQERDRIHHAKELADCLEGIILSQPTWFGVNAETIPTSEYDDFHGVDMIVEHKFGDAYAHDGIGVDITYGSAQYVNGKIHRLADRANRGELTRVKYFSSPTSNMRGEISKIPNVVIGCSADTMFELVNLFAEKDDGKLAAHPLQFQILEQMKEQAVLYREIAQKSRAINAHEVVQAYEALERRVAMIMKQKSLLYKPEEMLGRDESFGRFQHAVSTVKRSFKI